jgi:hypothetical protein
MTRLFLTISLLLILAFAAAQESYFPNRAGLSWTYNNGSTQTFTEERELDGMTVLVFVQYLDGTPVSEDYLQFSGTGVYSHGTAIGGQVFRYVPPLTIYEGERLELGQSWQSTSRMNNIAITLYAEVVGVRGVETPAGRFNALQILQRTSTSTGARTELTLYFVPTVGVVRWVTQDGTVIDLIEKNF